MINVKNKDFLFSLFSSIIIIATGIIWLIPEKTPIPEVDSNNNIIVYTKFKKIPLSPAKPNFQWVQAYSRTPAYNYNNLLLLVKKHRKIEARFYGNYKEFVKNIHNRNKTEQTLSNLKEEKTRFYRHMRQLDSFHKKRIPPKKNIALRYYLKTVENCIDSLEDIIKKFNVQIKN